MKICGITREQDAELAAGLGANALGFIFWPDSPRFISVAKAKAIVMKVPTQVLKVGVFVDQPVEEVASIVDEVGLDVAQLHGHESPEYCRQVTVRLSAANAPVGSAFPPPPRLRRVSPKLGEIGRAAADRRTVIKAVGMSENGSVTVEDFDPDVLLLVDAHDPARFGGTGRTVNWDVAREIAATRRTILAGGLNATNIKLAVRSVRPFGVDVSSGVESAPGVKDPQRLRTFFEALHD